MSAVHLENQLKQNEPEQKLSGARILLAEDDESIRSFLKFLFEMEGAQVNAVETGVETLVALQEEQYHLILLDLNLPVLNGEQAMLKLRRAGFTGPILAMSAYTESEKRQNCLEKGFDDYLTKPFDIDEMVDRLAVWKNRILTEQIKLQNSFFH
jgi:DNA-binding response OmpR family regulator